MFCNNVKILKQKSIKKTDILSSNFFPKITITSIDAKIFIHFQVLKITQIHTCGNWLHVRHMKFGKI